MFNRFKTKNDDVLDRRIKIKLIGLDGRMISRNVIIQDTFTVTDTTSNNPVFSIEFNSKHEVTIRVLAPFLNVDAIMMDFLKGSVLGH